MRCPNTRVPWITPIRLTWMSQSMSASAMSNARATRATPALLNKRSIPPACAQLRSANFSSSARWRTSTRAATAFAPRARTSAAVRSAASRSRSAMATKAAPFSASANAMPRPMPVAAPVTAARVPSIFMASPFNESPCYPRRKVRLVADLVMEGAPWGTDEHAVECTDQPPRLWCIKMCQIGRLIGIDVHGGEAVGILAIDEHGEGEDAGLFGGFSHCSVHRRQEILASVGLHVDGENGHIGRRRQVAT